eukprot:scaffold267945_cov33-Tisochrysis_lutea.AAC.1
MSPTASRPTGSDYCEALALEDYDWCHWPPTLLLLLAATERADVNPLSFGSPAEGGPPNHPEQSLSKRPRLPSEAKQARATPASRHT